MSPPRGFRWASVASRGAPTCRPTPAARGGGAVRAEVQRTPRWQIAEAEPYVVQYRDGNTDTDSPTAPYGTIVRYLVQHWCGKPYGTRTSVVRSR